MKRGERTVFRFCRCGCGEYVPPFISPTSNRVEGYPKFVPGHGRKDWGKRWTQRIKEIGHPSEKPIGSRSVAHSGYIKIKCADKKWRYEHRVVTSAPFGKIVHHLNENKSDNSLSNLKIMNHGEHIALHTSIDRWSRLFDACVVCNSAERSHAGQGKCTRCWQRANKEKLGHWPR